MAIAFYCRLLKGFLNPLPKLAVDRKRLAKKDDEKGDVLKVEMGGTMGRSNSEPAGQ